MCFLRAVSAVEEVSSALAKRQAIFRRFSEATDSPEPCLYDGFSIVLVSILMSVSRLELDADCLARPTHHTPTVLTGLFLVFFAVVAVQNVQGCMSQFLRIRHHSQSSAQLVWEEKDRTDPK